MNIIKLYNQYKTYIRCFAVAIIVLVTGALYYGMHGSGKDKSGADRASVSSVDSDSLDAAVLRGTQEDKELIYVYIYGEVNNPGVVGCKKDSRVYEVVEYVEAIQQTPMKAVLTLYVRYLMGKRYIFHMLEKTTARGFMMMILIRPHRSMLHRYMVITELHSRIRASISTQRLRSS